MPVLQIRSMSVEDIEQVVALDRMSFSLPWSESSYRFELLENKTSRLWVAEVVEPTGAKRLVGMVVTWIILDEAHIATIAVHPEYRRRGIAKRLIDHTLKDALQLGMKTATLEVRINNQAAQNLYKRYGFETVGLRPRYYKDTQEDALIMTVDLSKVMRRLLFTEPVILFDEEVRRES